MLTISVGSRAAKDTLDIHSEIENTPKHSNMQFGYFLKIGVDRFSPQSLNKEAYAVAPDTGDNAVVLENEELTSSSLTAMKELID